MVDGKDYKSALEYAVAASALKHTIPGDFNLVTRADVDNLAGGDVYKRQDIIIILGAKLHKF